MKGKTMPYRFTGRALRAALLLIVSALALAAQTVSPAPAELPQDYAAAGLFYNSYAQPHITGFGAYARRMGASTYSYSVIDVTTRSLKNFQPETSTTSGIAQHLRNFGGVDVYALLTAGVATAGNSTNTGADVGFSGSAGFMLVKPIRNGWTVNVPVRVLASTLGPPQYVIGIGFGWGK
jgi:hypothetical protein